MHVILAGAGVGGLSAALALTRRGIRATVLEQASAFAEAGAGLQLGPNACRVLAGWGLQPQLEAIAFKPSAVEVRDHRSGRLLLETELGAAAERRWGAPYLQVHRADLHALLVQAVQAQGGAELRLGAPVAGFGASGDGVVARLTGGQAVPADALIGCDGIRSTVREALLGTGAPPRFTGHVAWRGTVPSNALSRVSVPPVAAVWTGRRRHFVHYFVRGGALVNFLGVTERLNWTGESWMQPGDPAELAAEFEGWPEPVQALTRAVRETWRWGLFDRSPLPHWSRGPVSLLGDAAHAMAPFLAQGAAMAIEDAEALARALEGRSDVPAGLRAYEAKRRPRTARVQTWSRRNGRLFHLPALLGSLAFGLGGRVAARQLDWLYGYDPAG